MSSVECLVADLLLLFASVDCVVQVIRGLNKTMCSEVQVSIKESGSVVPNSIIHTREEPKDFLGKHDTLHMDQEERKRTAMKAQV